MLLLMDHALPCGTGTTVTGNLEGFFFDSSFPTLLAMQSDPRSRAALSTYTQPFLISQDMHGDATFSFLRDVCVLSSVVDASCFASDVGVGVELSCSSSSGCSDAPPLSFFLRLSTSGFKIAQGPKKRKEKQQRDPSNSILLTRIHSSSSPLAVSEPSSPRSLSSSTPTRRPRSPSESLSVTRMSSLSSPDAARSTTTSWSS